MTALHQLLLRAGVARSCLAGQGAGMDTLQTSRQAAPGLTTRPHYFPVDLHPTHQQARMFTRWGQLTRQRHTCAAMMVLQGLQGDSPDAQACWSAVQSGTLPGGLIIPDPEMVFTAPGCLSQRAWDRDFPEVKSQVLHQAMRALTGLLPADLPYSVRDRVVDAVYAPLAKPRGGHQNQVAYGQRSFGEILKVPGFLDPLIIPVSDVTLAHPVQMSIPTREASCDVLAEIFSLPFRSWAPGDRVDGEIHQVEGRWRFWVRLPLPPHYPAPTRESVGVDPGVRNWLTCADNQGRAFTLEGPGEVLRDRLTQRAEAFGGVRHRFEEALAQLMQYRVIAVEGTPWTASSWKGGRIGLERMQAAALPQLVEWLAAYAHGHGGREILLTPAYASSLECSACVERGRRTRDGTWFVCSGCGAELDADVNGALNHLRRARHWRRPFRQHPLRYTRDWWRAGDRSPAGGQPLPFAVS